MKKAVKCYIYTRVSTAIQVDGYSLDAQKDKLRKYAEYQEMEIAGEYCDEGFSGKNIQGRLAFRQMLQDIEEQKDAVDLVLVFNGRSAYSDPTANIALYSVSAEWYKMKRLAIRLRLNGEEPDPMLFTGIFRRFITDPLEELM